MKIFDAHCDVLYKMWMNPTLSFENSQTLQVNLEELKRYPGSIQVFAIYIPEEVPHDQRFQVSLEMVDIFFEKIVSPYKEMKFINCRNDLNQINSGQIGAILSLEGCDAIGHDIIKLKTLLRLGVSSVGLTWNYANAVADGALEERGAGLTAFGKEVVKVLNEENRWTDVSHLSERGFWDVMEIANNPIASHSNAYSIVPHPRNLNDAQIKAIIEKNGIIGTAFVPQFLEQDENANIESVIKHIDHICSLGGENHIGLGSDFDGTDQVVKGLESFGKYDNLINQMLKYYSEEQVRKICFKNFFNRYPE